MNDQAAGLRKKVELNSSSQQARTVSIVSGKGGVGKSSIALNLSLSLQALGKKVIILDLDVGMGNINILLGLQPEKTIVDLFNEKLSIYDVIEKGPANLAYISGGSGFTEFLSLDEENKDYFFVQYQQLAKAYDYIIFDMGAGITHNSLFFVLASDEVIVVTTPEPTSITDAYSMVKQIVNYRKDMPVSFILNRAASKNEGIVALERFQKVVEQFLDIQTKSLGIIPEDRIVMQAVLQQKPFVLFNRRSQAARSIEKLAKQYVSASAELTETDSNSFVQRLIKLLRGKDE